MNNDHKITKDYIAAQHKLMQALRDVCDDVEETLSFKYKEKIYSIVIEDGAFHVAAIDQRV